MSDPYWEGAVDVAHCSETGPGHGLTPLDEMKKREEKKESLKSASSFLMSAWLPGSVVAFWRE